MSPGPAVLLPPGQLPPGCPRPPRLWCLWLTRVGQPCLLPLPQRHAPRARGAAVPGDAGALPMGRGCPVTPQGCCPSPSCGGREGGEGGTWGWIYWAGKAHRAKSKLLGKSEIAWAECVLSLFNYPATQVQILTGVEGAGQLLG